MNLMFSEKALSIVGLNVFLINPRAKPLFKYILIFWLLQSKKSANHLTNPCQQHQIINYKSYLSINQINEAIAALPI
jgi:hypothetical protein